MIFSYSACERKKIKDFTLRDGIAHFCFTYPASYGEPYVELGYAPSTTNVSIRRAPVAESDFPVYLWIRVKEASPESSNAEQEVKSLVILLETNVTNAIDPIFSSFGSIKSCRTIVANIDAYLLVYKAWWQDDFHNTHISTDAIIRNAFFDCDGLIWQISLVSPLENTEEAEAEFDSILQTFRILD